MHKPLVFCRFTDELREGKDLVARCTIPATKSRNQGKTKEDYPFLDLSSLPIRQVYYGDGLRKPGLVPQNMIKGKAHESRTIC